MGDYIIYVHINKINGKRYYGITSKGVKQRWGKNGMRYKRNKHFWSSICKYGWDNFEHIVIARGLTEKEAKWLEIELIREWNTRDDKHGYNGTKGGDDNPMNHNKYRKKVSKSLKGRKRKPLTEEHKQNISKGLNNFWDNATDEQRDKCSHKGEDNYWYSKPRYGEDNPNYGKTRSDEWKREHSKRMKARGLSGENHPLYGTHLTKEQKKKLSEKMKGNSNAKGYKHTEEQRKKCSESHKGLYDGIKNPSANIYKVIKTNKEIVYMCGNQIYNNPKYKHSKNGFLNISKQSFDKHIKPYENIDITRINDKKLKNKLTPYDGWKFIKIEKSDLEKIDLFD